jgi:D-alanyl-D-alanine carboxypeptidase
MNELRAVAACALLVTGAVAWGNEEVALNAVDVAARAAISDGEAIGLSIAVLRKGVPLHVRGYGMADLESSAAASGETVYYIGSITKTLTAAAILKLAEQGSLDIDDPVVDLVPELGADLAPVTLRHLLNHTSGVVGPGQVLDKFLPRRHLEFSRAELIALLQGEPRQSEAGSSWEYNNLGYLLLGIVIERISGMSYNEYLRQAILPPAGSPMLALCDMHEIIPQRARGYLLHEGAPRHHEPVNASLLFAAGGACASAPDVAVWMRALARGAVVSGALLESMTTPGTLADGTVIPYGLGLFTEILDEQRRLHHGGDANGFSAAAAHYLEADLTVVVLTNTRSRVARELERRIATLMLNQEIS